MSEAEVIYSRAREYAEGERQAALEDVKTMDEDRLKKEYVDLISLVAYYTKLEQAILATPRSHFDGLRAALKEIDADEILRQASIAEEEGMPIAGMARVKAKPLITLLGRIKALLPTLQESR
jgi:hypothetical protein